MKCESLSVKPTRAGVSLLEVVIALGLLGVITVSITQLSMRVHRYRRNSDQRRVALREAANLMEMLHAKVEQKDSLKLSTEVVQALPKARLRITVDPEREGKAQRLAIEIRWKDTSGLDVTPVILVAWR